MSLPVFVIFRSFVVPSRYFVRPVFSGVALCRLLSRVARRIGAAIGIFVLNFHQNVRLD